MGNKSSKKIAPIAIPGDTLAVVIDPPTLTMLMSISQFAIDNWSLFCEQQAGKKVEQEWDDMWDDMLEHVKRAASGMQALSVMYQQRRVEALLGEEVSDSQDMASKLLRLAAHMVETTGAEFDITCHFRRTDGNAECISQDPRKIAELLDSDDWYLVSSRRYQSAPVHKAWSS